MLQFSAVGLGTVKDDIITLQLAANRYAMDVGKVKLDTDGVLGPLTLDMVRAALSMLASKNVNASAASDLLSKVTSTAALQQNLAVVTTFLNDSMDTIRLSSTSVINTGALTTTPTATFNRTAIFGRLTFPVGTGSGSSGLSPSGSGSGFIPGSSSGGYRPDAPPIPSQPQATGTPIMKYVLIGVGALAAFYIAKQLMMRAQPAASASA